MIFAVLQMDVKNLNVQFSRCSDFALRRVVGLHVRTVFALKA
jgi:hypothetical protein